MFLYLYSMTGEDTAAPMGTLAFILCEDQRGKESSWPNRCGNFLLLTTPPVLCHCSARGSSEAPTISFDIRITGSWNRAIKGYRGSFIYIYCIYKPTSAFAFPNSWGCIYNKNRCQEENLTGSPSPSSKMYILYTEMGQVIVYVLIFSKSAIVEALHTYLLYLHFYNDSLSLVSCLRE